MPRTIGEISQDEFDFDAIWKEAERRGPSEVIADLIDDIFVILHALNAAHSATQVATDSLMELNSQQEHVAQGRIQILESQVNTLTEENERLHAILDGRIAHIAELEMQMGQS